MAESNEGIESLARIYANKNPELRRVSLFAYEAAMNTVREGSSGATIGVDPHFSPRQIGYVDAFDALLNELKASPIPDSFGLADTPFPINLAPAPSMVMTNKDGKTVPLNEDLQLITIEWYTLAVQIGRSDSAGIRGSMNDHDHKRAENQSALIRKRINAVAAGPKPDFTATGDASAKRTTGA